ncbi:MAG: response regulator [Candidatus Rokubacteria bacterium]|nr:response regulator [Candidatus Rokubacteria bacterium]
MATLARVLVVDDDPDVAELLQDVLLEENYEVRTAENGRIGLDLFDAWRPHVVLLDLRMPGMSGAEVFQRIRTMQPTTAVIFVTGADDEALARQLLREGAADYVRKPIDLEYCTLAVLLSVARAGSGAGGVAQTPEAFVQALYRLMRAIRSAADVSTRLREELEQLGHAALRDALAQLPERAAPQLEVLRRCLDGAAPGAIGHGDRVAVAAALADVEAAAP